MIPLILALSLTTIDPPECYGPVYPHYQETGLYWLSLGKWKNKECFYLYQGYTRIGFLLDNGKFKKVYWSYEYQTEYFDDDPSEPPIPRPKQIK